MANRSKKKKEQATALDGDASNRSESEYVQTVNDRHEGDGEQTTAIQDVASRESDRANPSTSNDQDKASTSEQGQKQTDNSNNSNPTRREPREWPCPMAMFAKATTTLFQLADCRTMTYANEPTKRVCVSEKAWLDCLWRKRRRKPSEYDVRCENL